MTQACCKPVLQSSTEQWERFFALTSAAVHVVASLQLYEEQVSIGVDAVAKAYCDPVLQRSTEQQGSCFVLTIAALLWCCITANLSEEQISICGTAVTQLLL